MRAINSRTLKGLPHNHPRPTPVRPPVNFFPPGSDHVIVQACLRSSRHTSIPAISGIITPAGSGQRCFKRQLQRRVPSAGQNGVADLRS
jgi:hypothetical protein